MSKSSICHQIILGFLLVLNVYHIIGATVRNGPNKTNLNIAIIGAGASGLITAKHSIAQGHNVTLYEQADEIGGIWVYTDETGKNKYGVDVHTAMYQGLRANSPYQLMEIPHYEFPNDTIPYPPQADVLKYLHSYADYFGLNKFIKLNHLVIRALPIENGQLEIIAKDLPNNKFTTKIYDAVLVCTGHFFKPFIPEIEGGSGFEGKIMHSHDFRRPEDFRGENVLIIGAGSSGVDLAVHLSKVADSVTLSQKKKPNDTEETLERFRKVLPLKTVLKYNVKKITPDGAEFIDGTRQSFTVIIYATSYRYSFPFLSVDSGIHIEKNLVQPLYKHIFNIEHPTMAFIGMIKYACNYMFDLQARFVMKFLAGEMSLPSKSEMLADWHETHIIRNETHDLGTVPREYMNELSAIAAIENVPEVMDAITIETGKDFREQQSEFRKFKFTIIDDKTFNKVKYED